MKIKEILNEIYSVIGKEYLMHDVAEAIINGEKENAHSVNSSLELFCELGYEFYYITCSNNKLALFQVIKDGRVYQNLEFCKPKKNPRVYKQVANNKLILVK